MRIDELKKLGHQPRMHGNGFVQLDIGPGVRLHVWPENWVPAQKVYTGIHDHAFSFRSIVMTGALSHRVYRRTDWGTPTHQAYVAERIDGEETCLVPDRVVGRCRLVQISERVINRGESYYFRAIELHASRPYNPCGPTATLMIKVGYIPTYRPVVMCPLGQEPDNDYKRTGQPASMLWEIIEEACVLMQDHLINEEIRGLLH